MTVLILVDFLITVRYLFESILSIIALFTLILVVSIYFRQAVHQILINLFDYTDYMTFVLL